MRRNPRGHVAAVSQLFYPVFKMLRGIVEFGGRPGAALTVASAGGMPNDPGRRVDGCRGLGYNSYMLTSVGARPRLSTTVFGERGRGAGALSDEIQPGERRCRHGEEDQGLDDDDRQVAAADGHEGLERGLDPECGDGGDQERA